MLGIILCLVTLIGALGGSLRFQENFYEEVFDLVDEAGEDDMPTKGHKDQYAVKGNDESAMSEAEVVSNEQVESASPPPPEAPEVEEEAVEGIEPYDQDEVFASI